MKRQTIEEYASSGKNDKFGMMYVSMLKSKSLSTVRSHRAAAADVYKGKGK